MIVAQKRLFRVLLSLITASVLWAQAPSPDSNIQFTYEWKPLGIMPLISVSYTHLTLPTN